MWCAVAHGAAEGNDDRQTTDEPLMMLLFLFGFKVNAKLFRIFNAMKMEEGCALSVCVCKE